MQHLAEPFSAPEMRQLRPQVRDAEMPNGLPVHFKRPSGGYPLHTGYSAFASGHPLAVEGPQNVTPWVFLERALHPPNADGLLVTNRQIADETRTIIERTKPTYKLDLLFVDELQFWPTWTCLPVSAQFIDSVHVSISCLETQVPVLRAFLWSFRGPPQSMWALYILLEFYLEHGLTHCHNDAEGQTRRPIVVRNITLDFIDLHDAPPGANLVTTADIRTFMATANSSLPLQSPDYTAWHLRASSRHPVAGDASIAAPWFARVVRDFLRLLLQDVWSIRYAGVLHRRVGVMSIAVSGGTVDTCDITVALALLKIRGPPENYRSFTPTTTTTTTGSSTT